MEKTYRAITDLILRAKKESQEKLMEADPIFDQMRGMDWPIKCTVGPGLEGAIACKSRVGFVNGSEGSLIYRAMISSISAPIPALRRFAISFSMASFQMRRIWPHSIEASKNIGSCQIPCG